MNLKSMLRSKPNQHPELHKRAHDLGDAIMQIAYPGDDHMEHWARFVPTITHRRTETPAQALPQPLS